MSSNPCSHDLANCKANRQKTLAQINKSTTRARSYPTSYYYCYYYLYPR